MIGVNITSKNGLMLFSHFFVPGFSDVDEDLRAGLMTAVLNAVKETQDGSELRSIDQGRYFVHIIEGEYTYGLYFGFENDLKEHEFAEATLSKFETSFRKQLIDGLSFSSEMFDDFHDYLKEKYSEIISIDAVGLSKIIKLMEDAIYSDYIILAKPWYHQVFTAITIPEINPIANSLGLMCKNLLESGLKIGLEISRIRFRIRSAYYVFVDTLKDRFFLILIVPEKEFERGERELARIKNRIERVI
ncbi:MAG: hypothetical protein ACFFFG_14485 [Candidatus Thorarchaeota archaeon]